MPFPMKIDTHSPEDPARFKPVVKSRLKRLFERQFQGSAAVAPAAEEAHFGCDDSAEFEPSSVCLDKMVQNFIEKQSGAVRCGRRCCNCFNRTCSDSADDEFGAEASEALKSLVLYVSVEERNLVADTAKIVEKNKICKRKDEFSRKIVADGLLALGYDASICRSRWEKSASYPPGEYEYIDAVIEGERMIVDIDFRSEFEIARSTKAYRSILNSLPHIFVGKPDRLEKIVGVVCDAAKQSLKKRAMHVPPWRTPDYVKSKWLSPYKRLAPSPETDLKQAVALSSGEEEEKEKGAWKPPEVKNIVAGRLRSSEMSGELQILKLI